MRTKFHIAYADKKKKPRETTVFAESWEEAEAIFAGNYKGCRILSEKKDGAKEQNNQPKPIAFCRSETGINMITWEMSCMLLFAGIPKSPFDWYAEQKEVPNWKYHVLFLTEEISDPTAMIIADHFVEEPEGGLTMGFIRKLYCEYVRKGEIEETQALHVCCVERKERKE
jgi:hypothetical protein